MEERKKTLISSYKSSKKERKTPKKTRKNYDARATHQQHAKVEQPAEFQPADLGIHQTVRAARIPGEAANGGKEGDHEAATLDHAGVAKAAAEEGLAALAGQPGPTGDGLAYGAALCLWHLGRHGSLGGAVQAVRGVLEGGKALEHLRRMR